MIGRAALWGQFGAAIEMLENALLACPDDLLLDRSRRPEIWYLVYHTLFFIDYYLDPSPADFQPAPFDSFGLAELLPEGEAPPPERAYTKAELHGYLEHCRNKCRNRIDALTDEEAGRPCAVEWLRELSVGEAHLYTLRHVQHHAAQVNLLLRQTTDSAPGWVGRTL